MRTTMLSILLTISFVGAAFGGTISTTGEATVFVTPDEVSISFGIETADPSLDKAKSVNDAESTKLLAALKAVGVPEKDIQTDTITVELRYKNGHEHLIESYVTRRMYSVKLKDVKLLEKAVDTGLKNGANRLIGLEYKTTELRKYRDQARKLAIVAAKEKAVALATELDCKVGKPQSISEGYIHSGYNSHAWWGYGGGYGNNSQVVANQGGAAGDDGVTMPLGQMSVKASVSVTFNLD